MRGGTRAARLVVAPAGLALAASLLGGCASEQEQYCEAVEEHQPQLIEIAADTRQDAIFRALPIYAELAEEAPSDIADDWDVVVGRLRALDDAFDEAGVDPATYDPKQPPAGLAAADREAIAAAASDLAEPQTAESMSSVEQQARDVCGTELGSATLGE